MVTKSKWISEKQRNWNRYVHIPRQNIVVRIAEEQLNVEETEEAAEDMGLVGWQDKVR